MSFRFYKTNKEVMDFDCKTEVNKILFNHYIMRKVNLHRLKGDLPDDQFMFSTRSAAMDLNLSKTTLARLVTEFESKNIIEPVKKSSVGRAYSVYQYVIKDNVKTIKKTEPFVGTVTGTDEGTVELSEFKGLSDVSEPLKGTTSGDISGTSNIENLYRELKINNIYSRVVDYLNKKTNKRFRYTSNKTRTLITARLNEDFVEEDFYKVIDTKCEQWKNTTMEKYLRPETLFSNKFEGYLNEVGQAKADDGMVDDDRVSYGKLDGEMVNDEMKIIPYEIDFKY